MKTHNCCGDAMSCEIEAELPDDYMDNLFRIYMKECQDAGKEPLSKEQWIKAITE